MNASEIVMIMSVLIMVLNFFMIAIGIHMSKYYVYFLVEQALRDITNGKRPPIKPVKSTKNARDGVDYL